MSKLVNLLAAEAILRTASGEKVAPREAKVLNLPTGPLEKCRKDLDKLCLEAGMKLGCSFAATNAGICVASCNLESLHFAQSSFFTELLSCLICFFPCVCVCVRVDAVSTGFVGLSLTAAYLFLIKRACCS